MPLLIWATAADTENIMMYLQSRNDWDWSKSRGVEVVVTAPV